ncbi:hypothetical protein KZ813_14075 [Sphingomonas sp. RHCKR7]|uniref:hypothetical protein n=1 Tax=Sphingomonas folli TaxID=2862497 RepID=UPI001CA57080|nr:hypothetical protein [Sphingomonas folli]MBW6527967.1 hypothetical protein [Sphingomonas folli]
MIYMYAAAAALLLVGGAAGAQTVAAPVQPEAVAPIAAPVTGQAVLRTGTEVPLKLTEELTTKGKKLKIGQRVHLETAEPLLVQGTTVVPAGTPAMGELTEVRNKGMWGKSGHFAARLLYLTVNGRQVRLSGGFDDKGTAGGIGATAVSALVFLPAGFFMTGTSAHLAIGTPVKGFVDEDVPLAFAAAGPAPLAVTPAAATPIVAAAAAAPVAAAVPVAAVMPAK